MASSPSSLRTVLVTGGAGFIGSAAVRLLVSRGVRAVVLDKLTYAANRAALAECEGQAGFRFVQGDIADAPLVSALLREETPDAVLHLAAESHVDRSIDAPASFVETNVVGTVRLLDAVLHWWRDLPEERRTAFRFQQVSTDETFGALAVGEPPFTEASAYAPNSPYAASKAAADHFVRAWHKTYGLPVVRSNSTNSYGPWQYPEKLIPVAILAAAAGRPIPLYGSGEQTRDWIHVDDHARALLALMERGVPGEAYGIGACCERSNREIAETIAALVDARLGRAGRADRIALVADRPGHDARYALDTRKVERELGWRPQVDFDAGLAATVDWYLENRGLWAG